MIKITLRYVFFCCLLMLADSAWASEPDAQTKAEVAHLISYLEHSGCKFQRNDSWHTSSRAADHIRGKYKYLMRKNLVPNTEAFIERAASISSRSGKNYQVQCGDNPPMPSAQWLREELIRYRSAH